MNLIRHAQYTFTVKEIIDVLVDRYGLENNFDPSGMKFNGKLIYGVCEDGRDMANGLDGTDAIYGYSIGLELTCYLTAQEMEPIKKGDES